MKDQVLLVEGESDKKFYDALIKILELRAEVHVSPPKGFDKQIYDSKGGIFNLLPLLMRQMLDGTIRNLGVVIDADYYEHDGMGYDMTLQKFASAVCASGFTQQHRVGEQGGFKFLHDDGLNPIGLWVMPNNKSDGMVEDWILSAIIDAERPLVEYAMKAVARCPIPVKFKKFHLAKAQIATWLAWQKMPGKGAHEAIKDGLIDLDSLDAHRLTLWMRQMFP